MNVIRVTGRWINLDYFILAEEVGAGVSGLPGGPETLRLTLYPGNTIGFSGPDADLLKERLGELESGPTPGRAPDPSGTPRASVSAGETLDLGGGGRRPDDVQPKRRKGRG